jgi:hypothetical protein
MFCGILSSETTLATLCDPIKQLVGLGWAGSRYVNAKESTLRSLSRCKAFSLIHQYPGCPIVASAARYVLRLTKPYHKKMIDMIDNKHLLDRYKEQYFDKKKFYGNNNVPEDDISMSSRQVIEDHFNISISKQLQIEKYFDDCVSWDPIPWKMFVCEIPPDWFYFSDHYIVPDDKSGKQYMDFIIQSVDRSNLFSF